MAEAKKRKYRLFAMPLNTDNITIAARERFSRATPTPAPGYVLVYTDGKRPKDSEEITKERLGLLSTADEMWLFDSNMALLASKVEKHKPEMLKGISESIEALEAELQRKKEEIEKKGD